MAWLKLLPAWKDREKYKSLHKGKTHYNELKKQEYNIGIGVEEVRENQNSKNIRKQLEVDFIAYKGNNKYYIQSAFTPHDNNRKIQEERPLLNIDDSFKKIIVVSQYMKLKRDDKSITAMKIRVFLKNENSLDL